MSNSMGDSLRGFSHSPAFKTFVIGTLIFLLTIPLFAVWGLVQERENNAQSVRRDVARSWGGDQTMTGPFLIIPYTVRRIVERDKKRVEEDYSYHAVFLPEVLMVDGDARSKVLKRSIYDVTVYRAELGISGEFSAPDMAKLAPDAYKVRWEDAVLAFGLSNVSGLKNTADVIIDGGRKLSLEPSMGVDQGRRPMTGVHVVLGDRDGGPITGFKFDLKLGFSGSSNILFAPVARETSIAMKSDWPHPSFTGAFLPASRKISATGFSANWKVPHLARSVPHSWTSASAELNKFGGTNFGVRFYIPIDFYDLVNRSVKYGLMFLLVGFASVFILELLSGVRVHAVQYLFVGLALVFFFVLLLSLSEHFGFRWAYLIGAGATGGMLSLYVARAMESAQKGQIMFGIFALLYGVLYFILTLEDYALLAGAITGFVLLTSAMFLTLGVNWSGDRSKSGVGDTASLDDASLDTALLDDGALDP